MSHISIIHLREARKDGEPCSTQPQSQSSAGGWRDGTVLGEQRRGTFGVHLCKTGSAYTGCVVSGRIAGAAKIYIGYSYMLTLETSSLLSTCSLKSQDRDLC